MAKRTAARRAHRTDQSGYAEVSPRQPCPCGSGKRYKACHGGSNTDLLVLRPFAGLAVEPELIALREFIPSATAMAPLADTTGRQVTIATLLPMAAAALVRADGVAFVGLQVQTRTGDLSGDLARAIRWAQTAEPGSSLAVAPPADSDAIRLQDLLDSQAQLDIQLHQDFSWWLADNAELTADAKASLEQANALIMPTEKVDIAQIRSAYWVDTGDKAHIRWVHPQQDEDQLLAALARLSVRNENQLGEDSRYAGSFRAHGRLVPVWDVDREQHVKEWLSPMAKLADRLDQALTSLADEPLNEIERRAREGLRGRQITLR